MQISVVVDGQVNTVVAIALQNTVSTSGLPLLGQTRSARFLGTASLISTSLSTSSTAMTYAWSLVGDVRTGARAWHADEQAAQQHGLTRAFNRSAWVRAARPVFAGFGEPDQHCRCACGQHWHQPRPERWSVCCWQDVHDAARHGHDRAVGCGTVRAGLHHQHGTHAKDPVSAVCVPWPLWALERLNACVDYMAMTAAERWIYRREPDVGRLWLHQVPRQRFKLYVRPERPMHWHAVLNSRPCSYAPASFSSD